MTSRFLLVLHEILKMNDDDDVSDDEMVAVIFGIPKKAIVKCQKSYCKMTHITAAVQAYRGKCVHWSRFITMTFLAPVNWGYFTGAIGLIPAKNVNFLFSNGLARAKPL